MLAFENKTKISSPHIHFENLDGLRFLAAFMVFFHHLFSLDIDKFEGINENNAFQLLKKVFNFGHYGVGIFFVISGFLIFSLLLNEYKNQQKVSWTNFFMRRILRIWPLYFLIILFGFFIFPFLPFGKTTVHHFSNYALFLSNFDEIWYGAKDSINFLTVTWSISVEEQLYYGTILTFIFLPANYFFKYGLYLFTGLIFVSCWFKFQHSNEERLVYYHTLTNMIYLAIGAVLAFLNKNNWVQNWVYKRSKKESIGLYISSIVLIGLMLLFRKHVVLFSDLIIACSFAIWMLIQTFGKYPILPLDQLLGFKKGGKITYGFYLYHTIIFYYVASMMQSFGINQGWLAFSLFALMSLVTTLLISQLSYTYFENPFLKMKKGFRSNKVTSNE
jgi:peptidoglycan/LPS O-acetylase OafA/YrhL